MPFAPHIRVTAIGYIGNALYEQFSYGVNMGNGSGTVPAWIGNETEWQDIANDVNAFHIRAATGIGSGCVLTTVKIASIGADGKYTDDPRIYSYNSPGGTAPPSGCLPQSALAVSFTTDRRGPTGKGRFFLPMPNATPVLADQYRISVASAEAVRGSVVTLLNDLNNHPGLDPGGSPVAVVASTKGYNTEIQGVRVGRVIDTMRSRRNKLVEGYTTTTALA